MDGDDWSKIDRSRCLEFVCWEANRAFRAYYRPGEGIDDDFLPNVVRTALSICHGCEKMRCAPGSCATEDALAKRQDTAVAGRDEILQNARYAIDAIAEGYPARSFVYYGLCGVGKTAILNHVEEYAVERGLLCRHIEVKDGSDLVKQLSIVCTGFVSALSSGENPSVNPENDFTELLVTLGKYAKQAGTAICFCIDEIQYASENELSSLITADHRINQLGLPVLFFCAGLPKILKNLGDAGSYAERLFSFVEVERLPER